jgi:hypothetical protein
MALERPAREGDSPVCESAEDSWLGILSTTGTLILWEAGGSTPKAKYTWRPIVNKYREGKVKSTP